MSAEERADPLIDERELAAALRGLRPDRDVFRAGVERRVREAAPEPEAGEATHDARELRAADSAWWRRAAAWLPGELVPGSLAATGAKLSWKALPGLLALPALTFAMLVAPVYLALRTLGSASGERAQERLDAVRAWWREHRRAALVTLAVIGLLFLRQPTSAGMALLLVSTGVLALLLARLRAAGFGTRADVARHCAHLLLAFAVWLAMFGGPWRALFPGDRSAKLAFFVLALGAIVCTWAGLRESHPTLWHLVTRSNGGDAVLLLVMVLLPPWSAGVLWSAFSGPTGLADQARQVERMQAHEFEGWNLARKTTAWLRHEGAEPELARLRAHWRARRAEGDERMAGFLAAGIDLGFVEPDELVGLASGARALLGEEGPIQGASLRERADLLALVRAGILAGESRGRAERDQLARRLLASKDAGPQPWALERLATVASLLDELDLGGLADGLRGDAHALLRESWLPPKRFFGRGTAGFFVRRWQANERPFVAHTHDAIDLMLRFGVPAEIDLAAVARGLERSGRQPFTRDEQAAIPWEAALALAQLERGLLPEASLLERVSANRVLLAMLVLASFCVVATLRAPREPFV